MKTLKKLFISFPLTLIVFIITILKYDLNCMEEYAEGYDHFLVWSMKGPSSLSYFIDTLAFIVDFLIIFLIIFISLLPFSTKLNKKFKKDIRSTVKSIQIICGNKILFTE